MSGRVPLLPSPDLEEHVIGKDRRRFIVISIFDATLTVLLWLICTVTKGDDWVASFLEEINIFSSEFIRVSLFDVVISALLRMVILIGCYAVFLVRHWIPVAITTSLSSVFLIIKVLFFFSHKQGNLPQYMLVLASFSISWFELWLMPFKVLPRERRLLDDFRQAAASVSSSSGRVTPRAFSVRPRPRVLDRLTGTNQVPFSTDDEFRSAVEFSSDDERVIGRSQEHAISTMLRQVYEKALADAETRVETLMKEARLGNWKVLRACSPMVLQGSDGTFFIKAEFKCSPLMLFNAAWKDMLKWNNQVVEGKTVLTIDSVTELYYSVSAPALRGYVSSRDFVDLRRIRFDSQKDSYQGTFVSVESTLCPANANKKLVRGTNGPSIIRTMRGDSHRESQMEWVMQTDLRGGLPKRIVMSSMLNYFVEHIDSLRKYIETQLPNIAASV